MNTVELREQLHLYIDRADDDVLRLVQGILVADDASFKPMTEEEFHARNEESQEAIRNGELVTQKDVRAYFKEKHAAQTRS